MSYCLFGQIVKQKAVHPFNPSILIISLPVSSAVRYPVTGFIFCGLFLVLSVSNLFGQDVFERGEAFYEQRHAEADSFRAPSANIDKAIEAFQNSLDQNNNPEESAAYLLKSYYFKGMYTGASEDEQKTIYERGRTFGEKMVEKFPDSAPIKFWYGANIGRWADLNGFVKAATNGVAPQLRELSKEIIELDPDYQGGGGYRILAQVHFYSPNIPLVLGWPSNEKALELIEKAMEIAPKFPPNRMLYAEILLEFDRMEEAKKELEYILDMEPRSTHVVEDRYIKYRCRQLLKENF